MARDYQRSKVYAWEQEYIAPHDSSQVRFEDIPAIVNYVWEAEGLLYPPAIEAFPKQMKRNAADATRLTLRFHEDQCTSTWIILHEIAHSMTSEAWGNSNQHGSDFVGVYILLASKYLGVRLSDLIVSARESKVDYNLGAVALQNR